MVAVFLFHVGWLPFGYLGVDLFFVLSGFLIVRNVTSKTAFLWKDYLQFLVKRLRRLAPALCLVMIAALLFGLYAMLPDDLENLGQSIVASSLYANNYLLFVTTKDYWDTINEFKPLLHTWSLGIEMQFYLSIPLLLVLLSKRYFTAVIVVLTFVSLAYSLSLDNPDLRFYGIFSRIYQFGLGAVVALLLRREVAVQSVWAASATLLALLLLFVVPLFDANDPWLSLIATLIPALFILTFPTKASWLDLLLSTKWLRQLGQISYSFYLWHFLLVVAVKYTWTHDLTAPQGLVLFILTYILSLLSYRLVENPLRSRQFLGNRPFMVLFVATSILLVACGAQLHRCSGVVRAVPELGITDLDVDAGMHSVYNASITPDTSVLSLDASRSSILLIGDSYARDFGNILKEYGIRPRDIRYCPLEWMPTMPEIAAPFDYVFVGMHATADNPLLDQGRLPPQWLSDERVYVLGSKNFGKNMGIVYNNLRSEDYCTQTNVLAPSYVSENMRLSKEYKGRYIDMLSPVLVGDRVEAFTPDCKFISQDGRHLTQAGASHYASILPLSTLLQ